MFYSDNIENICVSDCLNNKQFMLFVKIFCFIMNVSVYNIRNFVGLNRQKSVTKTFVVFLFREIKENMFESMVELKDI